MPEEYKYVVLKHMIHETEKKSPQYAVQGTIKKK